MGRSLEPHSCPSVAALRMLLIFLPFTWLEASLVCFTFSLPRFSSTDAQMAREGPSLVFHFSQCKMAWTVFYPSTGGRWLVLWYACIHLFICPYLISVKMPFGPLRASSWMLQVSPLHLNAISSFTYPKEPNGTATQKLADISKIFYNHSHLCRVDLNTDCHAMKFLRIKTEYCIVPDSPIMQSSAMGAQFTLLPLSQLYEQVYAGSKT